MEPPSPEEFYWFYTLKPSKGNLGFYYFTKQVTKEVQVITKIKENLGNLKDTFFFTPEDSVKGRFGEPSKIFAIFFLQYTYMRPSNFV